MLRFAPSLDADISIDDLRIAIVDYIIAKQRSDQYIIRIEDGDKDRDKDRNLEGKDTEVLEILEKFAIPHDRVFHQSENLHMHQTLAIRLLEEGRAFACTCTTEESDELHSCSAKCRDMSRDELSKIKAEKIPFVIRLKKPSSTIGYHDIIQGDIESTPDEIDDFVILRADSTPTYNFACACDDMLTAVDFIIRSEDHIYDTPKQIYIKELLGYSSETTYAHLPSILSSDDDISLLELLREGFIPDAIINYLVSIGSSSSKEIFILSEAIEWFKLENISKESVRFDREKLRYINSQHLYMMDDKRLSTIFGFADADIGKLVKIYLREASTISELESKIRPIFGSKEFSGEWGEQMRLLEGIISDLPFISEFDKFHELLAEKSGLTGDQFSKPLRILLTGTDNGPELCDIYPHIKSYLLEITS